MVKKEMIAMLLAGGQGSRLGVFTSKVAKPAVAFGGKYRIIDFPLSNCINSGVDTVGVLTQYQPLRLNTHIGIGIPWDLDRICWIYILPLSSLLFYSLSDINYPQVGSLIRRHAFLYVRPHVFRPKNPISRFRTTFSKNILVFFEQMSIILVKNVNLPRRYPCTRSISTVLFL